MRKTRANSFGFRFDFNFIFIHNLFLVSTVTLIRFFAVFQNVNERFYFWSIYRCHFSFIREFWTFIFDHKNIDSMTNWWPRELCETRDDTLVTWTQSFDCMHKMNERKKTIHKKFSNGTKWEKKREKYYQIVYRHDFQFFASKKTQKNRNFSTFFPFEIRTAHNFHRQKCHGFTHIVRKYIFLATVFFSVFSTCYLWNIYLLFYGFRLRVNAFQR